MPEPITIVGFGGGVLGLIVHLARRYFETAKEVADVVGGAVLLVLSMPLMAGCIVLIKFSGPGPAFHTQIRAGKGGKPFRMYKLRTMFVGAENDTGAVWAKQGDPRVMPWCRWMRRSHMDELPQLINVIKGDMSLVGPRPERPEIIHQLRQHYPDVDKRLAVRPGITGLAQVRNGYDKGIDGFQLKLESDLDYITRRRWSVDLAILMRTVGKLYDRAAH